jgi:dienelactone hydrolase
MRYTFLRKGGLYRAAFPVLAVIIVVSAGQVEARSFYAEGMKRALKCARENGFTRNIIQTEDFKLTAFSRISDPSTGTVRIYIEGDGSSWINRRTLSSNPTPKKTMVLELAGLDTAKNVVYLARPCQYVRKEEEKNFSSEYWSQKRFSAEVLTSMNEAVSRIKELAKAEHVELVGFSGGAAIAVILAARREDVTALITIAGNLDPVAVNKSAGVDPFLEYEDPLVCAPRLKDLPQRHFAAQKDRIIPLEVTEKFVAETGDRQLTRLTVVTGTEHSKGWARRWPGLLDLPLE